jgi:hypothetical protein
MRPSTPARRERSITNGLFSAMHVQSILTLSVLFDAILVAWMEQPS